MTEPPRDILPTGDASREERYIATVPPVPTEAPVGGTSATHGERILSNPRIHSGSRDDRRMLRWFFAATVAVYLAVVAVNALADPHGVVGTGRFQVVTFEWVDRVHKVRLLADLESPPDVLVLGASTTREVDPADIEKIAGKQAFNASVSAGSPLDVYTLAAYAAELFPDDYPHLLWGLDIEAMHDTQPNPAVTSRPELRRQLPWRQRVRISIESLQPLFDLRTLPLSVRTIRQGPARPLAPATKKFRPDGFRRSDPLAGANLQKRLPNQIERYSSTLYRSGEFRSLGERSRYYVEQTLAVANEHGDEPTIFLTPMHPRAVEVLGPLGRDRRERELRAFLDELGHTYEFQLIDLTDIESFDGQPSAFRDAVHMNMKNVRRMLEELHRRRAV